MEKTSGTYFEGCLITFFFPDDRVRDISPASSFMRLIAFLILSSIATERVRTSPTTISKCSSFLMIGHRSIRPLARQYHTASNKRQGKSLRETERKESRGGSEK